jgi:hypothetical protein
MIVRVVSQNYSLKRIARSIERIILSLVYFTTLNVARTCVFMLLHELLFIDLGLFGEEVKREF